MAAHPHELWRERLELPAYRVGEAARYARTSAKTVASWAKLRGNKSGALAPRSRGISLSYLQLIEIAVVASMRNAGITLSRIRQAREYLSGRLSSRFPFAEYKFKTDGKELFISYDQIEGDGVKDTLLSVNQQGQLAWNEILGRRLREFEYDKSIGKVLRWRVGGIDSRITIDPRISFGAPTVNGIATWVLRERWHAGESTPDIADDYDLRDDEVLEALRFEGIEPNESRPSKWIH